MQRASEVQARIHSLRELGDVVGALRSVSAARVQQAHAVLDSVRQYTAIIRDALSEAARGAALPPQPDATAEAGGFVIAFGAEHGFVGGFNDRVLDHAAIQRKKRDELLVVGSRCVLGANERRDPVSWSCAMATQVGGIDDIALRIAERLGQPGGHGDVERVILVYTRSSGGPTWRIVTETLLPFDIQPYLPRGMDRPIALSNLEPRALLDGLIAELLFAQLAHAATESFASENAARLAAMESAADNVEGKLDDLGRVERELRQEEITTELLDIVTGAEAIAGETSREGVVR
jgi:F-type H+-transporting ATPase subunit gamma